MKHTRNVDCILVVIFCAFLLASYITSQRLFESNQDYNEVITSKSPENLMIPSLCELIYNPTNYHKRVVQLKTTLYRIASITTLGDEQCVQRHPLIDVEFSSNFESSVCNSNEDFKDKLCLIVKSTRQNETNENYEVIANIIGHFEYYFSKEDFTLNGLRFRFVIHEIENLEEITPIKSEKLH